MIKTEKQILGKRSRRKGNDWEAIVRQDLERQGYFVCRWSNILLPDKTIPENEEVLTWKIAPAKPKWNPFMKRLIMGKGGMPDFVVINHVKGFEGSPQYDVFAVECKVAKYLSKIEKEMCRWYLKKKVFRKILIAYKKEGDTTVFYEEFT